MDYSDVYKLKSIDQYKDKFSRSLFVVVGNGLSRKNFDLVEIKSYGPIVIGCNALYRDFRPDFLVCQDNGILEEVLTSSYRDPVLSTPGVIRNVANKLRLDLDGLDYVSLLEDNKYGNSGAAAIATAIILGAQHIYLIGFDGYTMTKDGRQNNIYYGTKNYTTAYCSPNGETHSWIESFNEVTKDYRGVLYSVGNAFYPCETVSHGAFASGLVQYIPRFSKTT